MSVDLVAHRAGQRLAAAASDADAARALELVLARRDPTRGRGRLWVVAAACAASLLLVSWLVAPGMASWRQARTDPARQSDGDVVGRGLPVAGELRTPEGWHAVHDGRYVVLAPDHGDPRGLRVVVGVPARRYDAGGGTHPLRNDLLRWIGHHPALTATSRQDVTVAGRTATVVQLHIRPHQRWRLAHGGCVGLVQLRDDDTLETVSYTWGGGTNLWAVVPIAGRSLLVAAWSPRPDDADLVAAFHSTLQSLQLAPAVHD